MKTNTLKSLGLPAREISINELGILAVDNSLDKKQAKILSAALDFANELQAEIINFHPDNSAILTSDDAVSRVYGILRNRPAEESWALALDKDYCPIDFLPLSRSLTSPKTKSLIVFKIVSEIKLDALTCKIVNSLKASLNYKGISLVDYILLKKGAFYSFADETETKLNF